MIRAGATALALLAGLAGGAQAADCFEQAAGYYGLDATLLRTIAQVESAQNPRAVHTNSDGSRDIGIMQINEWWLRSLSQFGITEAHLFDRCTNIFVGAWVLAQEVTAKGANWRAVGAYNSKTPATARAYAKRIWVHYQKTKKPPVQ
jgi:soluble lytic murein transglycosylase-like protein